MTTDFWQVPFSLSPKFYSKYKPVRQNQTGAFLLRQNAVDFV